MKIRSGFVSNSSSSSFCILGMAFDEKSLSTIYNKIYGNTKDMFDMVDDFFGNTDRSNQLSYTFGIEDYFEKVIIGIGPSNLEENKTIKEHKIIIAKKLSKLLKKEIGIKDIDFHIDGGREG